MAEQDAVPSSFLAGAGPYDDDVQRASGIFAWLQQVAGGPSPCLAPLWRVALTQKQRGGWCGCGCGCGSVVGSVFEAEGCQGWAVHPRCHGAALMGMMSWGCSWTYSQAVQPKTPSTAEVGTGSMLSLTAQTIRHNSKLPHPITALLHP